MSAPAFSDLGPITLDQAIDGLAARLTPATEAEPVALAATLGRVLAEDVVSAIDVPPHDNAAMDGIAVFFADLAPAGETRLPMTARVAAGHPLDRPARRGEAVRIFTGAPMPEGPDTVVMQEDCRFEDGFVVIGPDQRPGANRRPAGEDVGRGQVALRAGTVLRAQEIGLAAAIGRTALPVRKPLRVAVFSTGDEVREPGTVLPPGGIHDANRYAVSALLRGLGCAVTDLGILPDRIEVVRDALAAAAPQADLLMTSGGVSAGEEDHVKAAVQALGRLAFWRVNMRPGRPVALGEVLGKPFVGLPGNPVAAMTTFLLLGRPLVLGLMGARITQPPRYPLPAAFSFRKKPGRREFLRARLVVEDGQSRVARFENDGSGILSSMTRSDGLLDLPEDLTAIVPGQLVRFLPFSEVLP